MNPLKQGLKQVKQAQSAPIFLVFIHESIKTRVETACPKRQPLCRHWSLSMNPLKQGLKLDGIAFKSQAVQVFIHESIKTRVETTNGHELG